MFCIVRAGWSGPTAECAEQVATARAAAFPKPHGAVGEQEQQQYEQPRRLIEDGQLSWECSLGFRVQAFCFCRTKFSFLWIPGPNINKQDLFNCISTRTQVYGSCVHVGGGFKMLQGHSEG